MNQLKKIGAKLGVRRKQAVLPPETNEYTLGESYADFYWESYDEDAYGEPVQK